MHSGDTILPMTGSVPHCMDGGEAKGAGVHRRSVMGTGWGLGASGEASGWEQILGGQ